MSESKSAMVTVEMLRKTHLLVSKLVSSVRHGWIRIYSFLMAQAKFLKIISRLPCPVLLKPVFASLAEATTRTGASLLRLPPSPFLDSRTIRE